MRCKLIKTTNTVAV